MNYFPEEFFFIKTTLLQPITGHLSSKLVFVIFSLSVFVSCGGKWEEEEATSSCVVGDPWEHVESEEEDEQEGRWCGGVVFGRGGGGRGSPSSFSILSALVGGAEEEGLSLPSPSSSLTDSKAWRFFR